MESYPDPRVIPGNFSPAMQVAAETPVGLLSLSSLSAARDGVSLRLDAVGNPVFILTSGIPDGPGDKLVLALKLAAQRGERPPVLLRGESSRSQEDDYTRGRFDLWFPLNADDL